MKKIMIMLGAVAMAAFVNAASVDWSLNYAAQGATWAGNGASVMVFDGADYSEIIKLVTDTGSKTLAADLAGYSIGSSTFKNNRGAATAKGAVDGAPNSMFWMIFADGSMADGASVLWTAATDVTENFYLPPASGAELGLNAASFANSGTIAKFEESTSGDVPEPTSGLLLLVGVAGLALRRRRA